MPAKKFRFVSPGVQIKEIDKSQLPRLPEAIGPVVVGRTLRGPGMVPVTVGSYEEFVEKFGAPDRGAGSTDVWRNGNTTSPTYAAYAAEAWLKNSSPLTMVRLMGTEHPQAIENEGLSEAGWKTTKAIGTGSLADNGGAYGLFVMPSGSNTDTVTGSLAAIFYVDEGSIRLAGNLPNGTAVADAKGSSALVKNQASDYEFKAVIGSGSSEETYVFNFNRSSSKYIRKVFNTNPTLVNDAITPAASLKTFWLGETFETHLRDSVANGDVLGMLAPLQSGSVNFGNHKGVPAQPGKTGWVIGQDLNPLREQFAYSKMPKLFRLVASEGLGGDWEQGNVKVSIMDIKYPKNEYQKYGTFTVAVRKIDDVDANPEFVEVFTNCNLDPSSPDYIAAKIGDRHLEWDDDEKRHKELGEYPNISRYIRVEMNPVIEQGGLDPELQ